jgi:hypothetical protein
MAAPQIPNLNSLRRGRGRGRGIGRSTDNGSDSRPSAKDRIVQGTDNDASVSRLSAVDLGYLTDAYATALTPRGSATRRFPIINRGMFTSPRCQTREGEEVGVWFGPKTCKLTRFSFFSRNICSHNSNRPARHTLSRPLYTRTNPNEA